MSSRLLLKLVLLGFIGASLATTLHKAALSKAEALRAAGKAAAAEKGRPAAAQKTAVVYYFYTAARCASCQKLEAYTREAVETRLAAGYKGWTVEFRGVNLDEAPNAHFAGDYGLTSKSVVVQKYAGDKPLNWAKLDRAWELLGDKAAFLDYVDDEARRAMDAENG